MSTDEQKQAATEALAEAVFGTSRSSAPVKPAPALVLGLQSGAGRAFRSGRRSSAPSTPSAASTRT